MGAWLGDLGQLGPDPGQVLAQAPGLAAGVMEGADDFEAVGAEALGA